MAQMTDALISNAGRIAASDATAIANIAKGAQLGLGTHLPYLDAATPLTLMPVIPIVTHTPTMFAGLPHFDAVCKALVERHAKTIDGIDVQYDLEGAPSPAGHDGQEFNVPTNSKRQQPNPSMTFPEVNGNLVWNFHKNWIQMIKHPDTQASQMSALSTNATQMPPMVASYYSMDVLFIQFDQTMLPENIIDAYFITNMWPKGTGPAGFKRAIGTTEAVERTIEYHGILQHNRNTRLVGQQVAAVLNLHTVNFDFAAPIARSVEARLSQEGLRREVTDAVSTFTQVA